MENRVGDHIPSEAEIAKLVKAIEDIATKIEGWTVLLNKDERKTLAKFRTGGEKVVRRVADLAKSYGADNPDTPVEGMLADLTLADRIQPLVKATATLAMRVDDTQLQAEGECWHAATSNYTVLRERAKNNATLASELEEVRGFFATGKRRARAGSASGSGGAK